MMDKELNVRVAKVMGWHWDNDWGCLIPPEQKAKPDEMWSDWKDDGDGEEYREPIKAHLVSGVSYNGDFTKIILPEYSTDSTASRSMENWMDHQGSIARTAYGNALVGILGIVQYPDFWSDGGKVWAVACATPEDRCKAFLKAAKK